MNDVGQTLDDLLERVWDALEEEDYDEAEVFGRRALMADATSVQARVGLARALLGKEAYEGALHLLSEAAELSPDDVEVRTDLGIAQFEQCEFREALKNIDRALELGADMPDAYYWKALLLEREGDYRTAEGYFLKAEERDPHAFPRPQRLSRDEFRKAVEEARERLPREFDRALENVAIRIEDLPDEAILRDSQPPLDPCLVGLYVGVPLPDQYVTDTTPRLPDQVFLFQRNLERSCEDWDSLVDEIYTTLHHEVGHYMGYDEDDLAERGYA